MQTFVPYGTNFARNAGCLDRQRLGKQRVETLQILNALTEPEYGWQHHPAVKMWRGYIPALAMYGEHMCWEWVNRGYKDSTLLKIQEFFEHPLAVNSQMPPWLERRDVIDSHRSNLLRKDPDWYARYEWTVPNDLPYVWPVI